MSSAADLTRNGTLTGAPQSSTEVIYHGKVYNVVREGAAEILALKQPDNAASAKGRTSKAQSVFYNPVQQYNRDLSVLAIRAFAEDLAAIRKARHVRRLQDLSKGQKQGQKRKRAQQGDSQDYEKFVVVKNEEVEAKSISNHTPQREVSEPDQGIPNQPSSSGGPNGSQPPVKRQKLMSDNSVDNAQREEYKEDARLEHSQYKEENETRPAPQPSFRILDALSATGLRALRYAKEIPMVTTVTANDLSPSATASIRLNIEHNMLSEKIIPNTSDAIEHMHYAAARGLGGDKHYHVIDLDPYGTAVPFLDASIQAIVDGGLLCVTCTDAGVFASLGYLEKAYSQYGGLPLKGPHAHEGGLRLVLHAIAVSAARYGVAIEPLLSLSIDFYIRVFVRLHRKPAEVKYLASKTMVVYNCDSGCGAWSTQYLARAREKQSKNGEIFYNFTAALAPSVGPGCQYCGFKTHLAGPMWGGPLHNPQFVKRILEMLPSLDEKVYGTIPRIEGMLSVALDETLHEPTSSSSSASSDRPVPTTNPAIRSHHPFFFLPSSLSRVLHCVAPPDAAVRGALTKLGYRSSRSHTKPGSICTDAPWDVIWEIMREWVRQKSPVKEDAIKKGTAGWGIMQKDRGKLKVMEARKTLREAVNNPNIKDVDGLRKEMEAALFRLSQSEDKSADPVNGIVEGSHGAVVTNGKGKQDNADDEQVVPEKDVSQLQIVFDERLGREKEGRRMVRYQANPRADWGPMHKAKGGG